ncbi:hypothetical protein [Flaviflexus equikiangi]|uniref:XapX domain-containing protein n=1 Tax=Flaviflexus equikiangi TaxID=2758573 RepID=A0ABS2TCJ6_9ACTO|nr:hypothetical protein [Flaviflexus equikiangi]MBM9432370.1 hypothetical protein [Flaviflexus equikiangi]
MKTFLISGALFLVSTGLWVTHLPSPNPVNGSFLVMCAAAGMTLRALHEIEADHA